MSQQMTTPSPTSQAIPSAAEAAGPFLVQMTGIDKSFPGVHALDDCKFELRPGEVHALVGENGAGKSTLMKVLAGVYHKDAGRISLQGRKSRSNPRRARPGHQHDPSGA
jgi:ribose transport system ATP-binding protein